ncbi:MAG: hypothetical protein KKA73_16490 [Chloroflexi bacterium]|nr:hypothetical protein [Chloroflexota bacterium]MBU1749284.1 hypothetical protein [Chloroflexota bacterium]
MSPDDDVLPRDIMGFSTEARGGDSPRGLCLDLLVALDDELQAEGITGQPEELGRRNQAVLSGLRPCPRQAICERYHRAVARGGQPISRLPVQLSIW